MVKIARELGAIKSEKGSRSRFSMQDQGESISKWGKIKADSHWHGYIFSHDCLMYSSACMQQGDAYDSFFGVSKIMSKAIRIMLPLAPINAVDKATSDRYGNIDGRR